jgi:hypothetical protein
MPEIEEKRHVARSLMQLPVLYRRKAPEPVRAGAGWTHNLSEEGACMELSERLEAPSSIQLVFQTDQRGLTLSAEVIWAAAIKAKDHGVLHGVTFTDVTPDQRKALKELLRAK